MPTFPWVADMEPNGSTMKQKRNKRSVWSLTEEDIPLAWGDDLVCLDARYRFLNHLMWVKPYVAGGQVCAVKEKFIRQAVPSGSNDETGASSSERCYTSGHQQAITD